MTDCWRSLVWRYIRSDCLADMFDSRGSLRNSTYRSVADEWTSSNEVRESASRRLLATNPSGNYSVSQLAQDDTVAPGARKPN